MGSTVFFLMAVLNQRLGYARGERLAQLPDRLAHLASGQLSLGSLAFQLIKPLVKALVKLLT